MNKATLTEPARGHRGFNLRRLFSPRRSRKTVGFGDGTAQRSSDRSFVSRMLGAVKTKPNNTGYPSLKEFRKDQTGSTAAEILRTYRAKLEVGGVVMPEFEKDNGYLRLKFDVKDPEQKLLYTVRIRRNLERKRVLLEEKPDSKASKSSEADKKSRVYKTEFKRGWTVLVTPAPKSGSWFHPSTHKFEVFDESDLGQEVKAWQPIVKKLSFKWKQGRVALKLIAKLHEAISNDKAESDMALKKEFDGGYSFMVKHKGRTYMVILKNLKSSNQTSIVLIRDSEDNEQRADRYEIGNRDIQNNHALAVGLSLLRKDLT